MLVPMHELLQEAEKNNVAIPAFNFCNLETLYPILEAAKDLHAPVILQAAFSEVEYFGGHCVGEFVAKAVNSFRVQAALHLDHGKSLYEVIQCIRWGFTSVMFDGSNLSFEENVSVTRKIVEIAHAAGISVEGELGKVGGVEEVCLGAEEESLTDPRAAARFVQDTGVDALAIAIGNAHGFYKGEPRIDFERLLKTRELIGRFPIVLHGGTGIPDDQIKRAISLGIRKINFSTIIRARFIQAFRSYSSSNPGNFMLMEISRVAMDKVKEVVVNIFKLLGCVGLC